MSCVIILLARRPAISDSAWHVLDVIHNRSIAQVEWYLPDRRITPKPEHDIAEAAKHLISYTSLKAGREIEFSDAARDMFDSFCVMFNTRCAKFRKSQNPDAAAEEGTTGVLP